jgi:hypothetical protein
MRLADAIRDAQLFAHPFGDESFALWRTFLAALCAAHHQRCVHEGLGRIRIQGRAPEALRFEMPLSPMVPVRGFSVS